MTTFFHLQMHVSCLRKLKEKFCLCCKYFLCTFFCNFLCCIIIYSALQILKQWQNISLKNWNFNFTKKKFREIEIRIIFLYKKGVHKFLTIFFYSIFRPGQEAQKIYKAVYPMDSTQVKTKLIGYGFSLLEGK